MIDKLGFVFGLLSNAVYTQLTSGVDLILDPLDFSASYIGSLILPIIITLVYGRGKFNGKVFGIICVLANTMAYLGSSASSF